MNDHYLKLVARDNFHKLRQKSLLRDLLRIIVPNEYDKLLSFYDIRNLLGTKKEECYLGLSVVPMDKIIGSEGRYQDFTRTFLPKVKHLQERWVNISTAAKKDIILPPVQLFKVGNAYFVRDGNHRVSVARASGMEMIDAEVTEIAAHIYVSADMTHSQILQRVIEYEKKMTFKETRLANFIDTKYLRLTSPGSHTLIIQHIMGHKYFIEQKRRATQQPAPECKQLSQINPVLAQLDDATISFGEAAISWHNNLFQPIIKLIHRERLLAQFPKRTEADLYIWLISHWHYLKELYGADVPLEDAVMNYCHNIPASPWQRLRRFFTRRNRSK